MGNAISISYLSYVSRRYISADMAGSPQWNFFTNHAHVLICLARNPEQSLREVALSVGITERAVQRIVADLEGADYLSRARSGRRNTYVLHPDVHLRHALESHRTIGDLLDVIVVKEAESDGDDYKGLENWTVGEHGSEV